MHIQPEDHAFLAGVASFNDRFNAVRVGQSVQRLHHCFWPIAEITKAEVLRADWDVPNHLVPFYGDWHDLICLAADTGRVVAIDDGRQVVADWPSPQAFADSLCSVSEEETEGGSGIISAWIDI